MKRDQLTLVTLYGRHAGLVLGLPCHCGRRSCSIGLHVWDATKDMAPGLRAQTTDPRVRAWPADTCDVGTEQELPPDPTAQLHDQYVQLLEVYHQAALNLRDFLSRHRADRAIPLPAATAGDDIWCKNHLEVFGICEPRGEDRGELCRWCSDIRGAHGVLPDYPLMRARHERGRLTPSLMKDFEARTKSAGRKGKRRRAG